MVKNLKQIVLNIARLPGSDQRWILRHLTKEQAATLHRYEGLSLLKAAQRFRKLKVNGITSTTNSSPSLTAADPLPAYCQQLASKAPLYAAVVIDQGSYPWEKHFLQLFDNDGAIKKSLELQVPDLKPLVKTALFIEWERSISFESYLENEHG